MPPPKILKSFSKWPDLFGRSDMFTAKRGCPPIYQQLRLYHATLKLYKCGQSKVSNLSGRIWHCRAVLCHEAAPYRSGFATIGEICCAEPNKSWCWTISKIRISLFLSACFRSLCPMCPHIQGLRTPCLGMQLASASTSWAGGTGAGAVCWTRQAHEIS